MSAAAGITELCLCVPTWRQTTLPRDKQPSLGKNNPPWGQRWPSECVAVTDLIEPVSRDTPEVPQQQGEGGGRPSNFLLCPPSPQQEGGEGELISGKTGVEGGGGDIFHSFPDGFLRVPATGKCRPGASQRLPSKPARAQGSGYIPVLGRTGLTGGAAVFALAALGRAEASAGAGGEGRGQVLAARPPCAHLRCPLNSIQECPQV